MNNFITIYKSQLLLRLYCQIKKIKFGNLGKNVRIITKGSFFGNSQNIYIEDNVFISREMYMDAVSNIYISSGTMIGPRCTFLSGSHNYNSIDLQSVPYDNIMLDREIKIDQNVWIAANVTVCPGCHIGEGSVIGAGSCIYGEIPPYSVVVSSGYKIIKNRDISRYHTLSAQKMIYNNCFVGQPFIKRKG